MECVRNSLSKSSMCRVCMENHHEMMPISSYLEDAIIADAIVECTAVQISENDGLPENICVSCVEELSRFIGFIKRARKSDRQLKMMFKTEVKLERMNLVGLAISKGKELSSNQPDPEPVYVTEDSLTHSDVSDDVDFDDDNDSDYSEEKIERSSVRAKLSNGSPLEERDDEISVTEELDELEQECFKNIEVEGRVICCTCFKLFKSPEELIDHGKTIHEPTRSFNKNKKYICAFCFRQYSSAATLRIHCNRVKLIRRVYECVKCDAFFVDASKRRNHAHHHHTTKASILAAVSPNPETQEGRICCAQGCYQIFDTEKKLMEHSASAHKANKIQSLLNCSEQRPVECPICYKRLVDETGLKIHQQRVYLYKKHVCSICGLKFLQGSDCERHERKHRNEQNFKLAYHMRVHSGERPYPCRYCEFAFRDSTNRTRHEMNHTGIKPYKCDHCERAFRTKRSKIKHENTHSGRTSNKCKVLPDFQTTKCTQDAKKVQETLGDTCEQIE